MDARIAKLVGQARFEDERQPDGSVRIMVRIDEEHCAKLHKRAEESVWSQSEIGHAELLLLTYVYGDLRPRLADVLEKTGNELAAAQARIAELEAEMKRLSTPQWFYEADEPEIGYGDLGDVADNIRRGEVHRIAGAREVFRAWVALRVIAVDEDGAADETEAVAFATEPEAVAAWETSLAAARAAFEAARATIRHGGG